MIGITKTRAAAVSMVNRALIYGCVNVSVSVDEDTFNVFFPDGTLTRADILKILDGHGYEFTSENEP